MEEAREILRRSFFEVWDKNYPDAGVKSETEPDFSTLARECHISESCDLLDSIP
jgi:hypothetical protein